MCRAYILGGDGFRSKHGIELICIAVVKSSKWKQTKARNMDYFPWQVFWHSTCFWHDPSCGGCFSLTCVRPSGRPCVLSFLLNDPVLSLLHALLEIYLPSGCLSVVLLPSLCQPQKQASERARWVEVLTAKSVGPRLIPRTHKMEGENWFL